MPSPFSELFALLFSFVYTDHALEDYYVACRVSKNLAAGHGLVYTPGEKVHAFTSPLGVLIPAGINIVTGNISDSLTLWLFRILSAAALAAAAVTMLQIARSLSLCRNATVFLVAMIVLDVKIVDFTINGMESGFMILFMALTLKSLIVPGKYRVFQLGLAWAGLMWTRPDSFVYIAGLGIGFLLFSPQILGVRDRTSLVKTFIKSCIVAALFYLPWFVFAWSYYRSPIPNTVIAKGLNQHHAMKDILSVFFSILLFRFFIRALLQAFSLPLMLWAPGPIGLLLEQRVSLD